MRAALYINECCFSAAAQGDFIVEGSECMSADSVNHRLHIKIKRYWLMLGLGINSDQWVKDFISCGCSLGALTPGRN